MSGVRNDDLPSMDTQSRRRMRFTLVIVVLAVSRILFYCWIGMRDAENQILEDVEVRVTSVQRNDEADKRCFSLCEVQRTRRLDHFGGDLLETKDIHNMALVAKAKMVSKMKEDYGPENFSRIFEAKDGEKMHYRPVRPVSDGGSSMDRFKRKLKMKVLEVQVEIRKKEQNFDGCDCINGDEAVQNAPTVGNSTNSNLLDTFFTRYVWATGGHSAAASHGNLYNESYTVFLERAAKVVFSAVGIDLEGRNYAMGGTGSGLEISMCTKEIFGEDIDVLSWDYGMTDGRETKNALKLLHYFYRGAGLNPGRPAIFGNRLTGKKTVATKRFESLQNLEDLGLPVFHVNASERTAMRQHLPDTQGLSEEQISQMPKLVRNIKCGGKFEKGAPSCNADKYNNNVCPKRKGKASWHPGWKSHALDGNSWALFLTQALVDVLQDLSEDHHRHHHSSSSLNYDYYDPETILAELKAEEDALYDEFLRADLPEGAKALKFDEDDDDDDEFTLTSKDLNLLFRGSNICHTARTPSRTRFLGILTDTNKTGEPCPVGMETYDVGISRSEADDYSSPSIIKNGEMSLVFEKSERGKHYCPVTSRPDYKDFFYAGVKDDWVTLTIPNRAEKEAYRYDPSAVKGLIVIFLGNCDWGDCEPGDLRQEDFRNGTLQFEVNGSPVSALPALSHGGYVLHGENGHYWKPNAGGIFDIRARATAPKSYVRLSSVVLY